MKTNYCTPNCDEKIQQYIKKYFHLNKLFLKKEKDIFHDFTISI